jgi:hypothetical protein
MVPAWGGPSVTSVPDIGGATGNFLEAAETRFEFRAEIPVSIAEIKVIFERWQLAKYLERARQTGPFDSSEHDDDDLEIVEMERRDNIRRSANDLLLVERAKEWLLEEGD